MRTISVTLPEGAMDVDGNEAACLTHHIPGLTMSPGHHRFGGGADMLGHRQVEEVREMGIADGDFERVHAQGTGVDAPEREISLFVHFPSPVSEVFRKSIIPARLLQLKKH
jgi:hypothetical protein